MCVPNDTIFPTLVKSSALVHTRVLWVQVKSNLRNKEYGSIWDPSIIISWMTSASHLWHVAMLSKQSIPLALSRVAYIICSPTNAKLRAIGDRNNNLARLTTWVATCERQKIIRPSISEVVELQPLLSVISPLWDMVGD